MPVRRPARRFGTRVLLPGRTPDSWERVMPWGEPTGEQRHLLAAGHAVRLRVPVAGVWS